MSNPNETPEAQAERIASQREALTGLGRAVERAAGRAPSTVRLIPDLQGDLLHSLTWLSEVLTGWDEADLEDGEAFDDPDEAAAAAAAEDAVDRIIAVIRPTQTDPFLPSEVRVDGRWVPQSTAPEGYAGRLLAPDGRFELGPIRLVEGIGYDDITTIVGICERIIGGRGYLAEAADEVASAWDHRPVDVDEAPTGGAEVARRVLGVMAVLDRTPYLDANVETLVAALTGHDPNEDLVLTVAQAAAYQAWTTATNADLGGGPLERFARGGISY